MNFFDCGYNKDSIAREIAKWDSADLETELSKAGLPACRAFTREEWLGHPQGAALNRVSVIEIEKIADGEPVPFDPDAIFPLQGLRVLDFTHVLAGPRSARTLAEYGAEVLHISSPSYPDTFAQHLVVDVGKTCAYLDLRDSDDLETMKRLAEAPRSESGRFRQQLPSGSEQALRAVADRASCKERARHRLHDRQRLWSFRPLDRPPWL